MYVRNAGLSTRRREFRMIGEMEKSYQEFKFNRNVELIIDDKLIEGIDEVTLTIVYELDKETKRIVKEKSTIKIITVEYMEDLK
jgi:predicted YcjX-like family ATPase